MFLYIVSLLIKHPPREKHGARFLCIVPLLNKHPPGEIMVWVWVTMVLVTIGPSTSRKGFVCFIYYFLCYLCIPRWKARCRWVQSQFFETIIRRREGFVRVLCTVPMLIIHPHRWKHDVGGGNQGCVRWNVHILQRFLCHNKIYFYSSNY
jgi:hypothetical protein